MAWQKKAAKMTIGQFVRVKAERMAIIRFDGEPVEAKGKSFDGKPQDELQFPVTFWDERSVAERYGDGEAARIVNESKGEAKLFPVSGGPLLRELLAEDREEAIEGRTFIISHTGASRDTVYKLREVKLLRQRPLVETSDEDDEEEADAEEEEDKPATSGPHPRKDAPKPPTKKNRGIDETRTDRERREANGIPDEVEFKKFPKKDDEEEVVKKPRPRKAKPPVEQEEEPNEEEQAPAPKRGRKPKVQDSEEIPTKRTLVKDGKNVVESITEEEDPEKAKFKEAVKKRAEKVKKEEKMQDTQDEPVESDYEDEEEEDE